MNMPNTAPVTTRITSLDALRGIAVMGILWMNIVAFAMPSQAYVNPSAWGGTTIADYAAWMISFVLVDGKMRGLFSLIFGASMLLVIDAANARNGSGTSIHFRRMFWLLLFGAAHYYLLWFGDILFSYAAIGLVAFLFRNKSSQSLMKWSAGFLITNFLFYALLAIGFIAWQYSALQPGTDPAKLKAYHDLIAGLGAPGSAEILKEVAAYTGSYSDAAQQRINASAIGPVLGVLLWGVETLGLMLLGMALLRNGFLLGAWTKARYLRVAGLGYAIGLPPLIALALQCYMSGFDPVTTFNAVICWSAPFRIALITAHAAFALYLIGRFAGTAIMARITAAGRVAFTNYLGTTIVMTTIFYGYGFGLFGEVSRTTCYVFVLGGWAIMLLWSKPWLERFAYGPLEWVWRSLARGSLQSMRLH